MYVTCYIDISCYIMLDLTWYINGAVYLIKYVQIYYHI